MLDWDAPILPWTGLGNVKLYAKLGALEEVIASRRAKKFAYHTHLVRYEIPGKLYLFFHLVNEKLFKLTALENYRGALFGCIRMGMRMEEVLRLEPSFRYDAFEEVYYSPKGVHIETDAENNTVRWLSVYVRELEWEDFAAGRW